MTHSESSSAETSQAAVAAEAPGPNPAQADTKPPPPGIASTKRQSAIKSKKTWPPVSAPLAELLEEAKELLGTSSPEPSGTTRGQSSEADERARVAEIEQRASGTPPTHSAETANRLDRSGHTTTRIGRRALLQVVAALGATVIGYAFGHVVAGNDKAMRFFLAATVTTGLFWYSRPSRLR